MRDVNSDVRNAAIGRQDYVTDDTGARLIGLGALQPGTHTFALPVPGSGSLDATLTMSAHTGTVPTARLYATHIDGEVKGTPVAFAAPLADNTPATAPLTIGAGNLTQRVTLEITVPAASTATFSRAEWAAL